MKAEQFEVSTTHRLHLIPLDSLRGIASLFIVIMHFGPTPVIQKVFANAYLMVDLFFVLSGFTICYAYHDRLRTVAQVRRFIWLRFWRLYPIHIAMLTYFVGIELAKPMASLFMPVYHPAFSLGGWRDIAVNILLLQSFHLTNSVSFDGPSWSISAEFYVYLLFACIVFLLRRGSGAWWASLLIFSIAIVALALFNPRMDWSFDYGWVRGLAGFFAGALTFRIYQKLHLHARSSFDPGLAALSTLAILVAFIVFKPSMLYASIAIVPLSGFLILLIALSPPKGTITVLSSRPIRWLGVISYSIYMVHVAVGFALGYLAKTLMPGAATFPVQIALAMINIAIVIAVASGTFLWLEMPVRAWSRK